MSVSSCNSSRKKRKQPKNPKQNKTPCQPKPRKSGALLFLLFIDKKDFCPRAKSKMLFSKVVAEIERWWYLKEKMLSLASLVQWLHRAVCFDLFSSSDRDKSYWLQALLYSPTCELWRKEHSVVPQLPRRQQGTGENRWRRGLLLSMGGEAGEDVLILCP